MVNASLIEFIEATPDTVISLFNGKKIIVKESLEEITNMSIEYFKKIGIYNIASILPIKRNEASEESDEWT